MPDAIAIVDAAMRDLSSGRVVSPQRTVMSVNPATRLGLMPGAMPDLGRFGLKVVSLSTDAPKYGLPSHQGLMLLFDDASGKPLAALDTHALTRLRTAAASAVATRALARARCQDARYYRLRRSGGAAYRRDFGRASDPARGAVVAHAGESGSPGAGSYSDRARYKCRSHGGGGGGGG